MARRVELNLSSLSTEQLADLSEAAAGVLCSVFKVSPKALALTIERKMGQEIQGAWTAAAAAGLQTGAVTLMGGPLTKGRIDAFLAELGMKLSEPLKQDKRRAVQARVRQIYRISKEEAAHGVRGTFSFGRPDEAAIAASNNQQMFWINGFYNDQLSKRISAVSTDVLLEQGLSHREAGIVLRQSLAQELGLRPGAGPSEFAPKVPARYAGNVDYYFQQVASVSGHQSRTFGRMSAFDEAGVQTVQLVNPLDERTGAICRRMANQVLKVSSGIAQMAALMDAKTPQGVKDAAEWPSAASLDTALAGTKPGSEAASAALEKEGVILPPFHPLCRTEVVVLSFEPGARPAPAPEKPKPEEPPKPPPPPPPPPANPQLDQLIAERNKLTGYSGVATPGDGAMIENQDIRWRQETWEGVDYTLARFKLTEQHAPPVKSKLLSLDGELATEKPFQRSNIDAKTGHIDHTGGEVLPWGDYKAARATVKVQSGEARVSLGLPIDPKEDPGVYHNHVTVRIKEKDPKKAQQIFKEVAEKLGIADPTKPPSPEELKMLRQARILTQWDAAAGKQLRDMHYAQRVTPKAVDELFTRTVQRNPTLKSFLADAETAEVAPGHVAQYSEAMAKELNKHVDYVYHDLANPDTLVWILRQDNERGGLLSSMQRYERGMFARGMSSSEDIRTGGGESAFTRLHARDEGGGTHAQRVLIHPRVMGRTDWYFYPRDRYGRTGTNYLPERNTGPQIMDLAKRRAFRSDNEMMFPHGIPTKDMIGVVVSSNTERARLIKLCKEQGITKVNGKPIEDFFLSKVPDKLPGV